MHKACWRLNVALLTFQKTLNIITLTTTLSCLTFVDILASSSAHHLIIMAENAVICVFSSKDHSVSSCQQINTVFPFVSSGSIRLETRVFSATSVSSLRAPPTPSSHGPVYCFYDAQNQHIFLYCKEIHLNNALCVVLSFKSLFSLKTRFFKKSN